ncbi:hypothetical protein H4Q26_016542 [Puccinia striiformis f. sp. tritici PST-130]|nr:hypothetical protein H4Q26_016542 [Puccinia striiformis f. sp. tritici PST-130]
MPPKRTTNAQKRAVLLKGKGSSTTPKTTKSKKKAETVEEVSTTQSHLKREDYQIIINWLRNKRNFERCHGYDKAPPVGRPVKGTINGFELMAINLRNLSPSKIVLNARQMKERFKTYKGKFKKAHTESLSTGFGLTAADKKKGIKTIEAKLDNMCPLYAEMYELVNQKPDVNPLCKVDAEDSEEISDSNDDDSSSSSDESSDNSDSVMIEPSLRDPKKIKRTQTAADLDGEILPGQSGQSEVVNGDLFRPEEEHQQDRNDLGETWGLEEEEQQSDCLPSGDEILHPQSKSVPKDNVVQTASKDVNEDEPNDSPRKKSGSKRKRKHSSKLTPAELAMDDPTEEEESDEVYSPSKKKATQKKKKHQTPLTPAERAMDEDSDEDDEDTPPPKTSPSKGKRRASNSKNINPKSHSGPNSVASPFLAFEEYAKKKRGRYVIVSIHPCFERQLSDLLFTAGKSQQAGDVLGFEKMKYDRLIAKENKSINLEDKKFDHTKQMENKKWDHSIELEGKKWNQGIKAEESKLKWEADEKEKDRRFEIEKMNTQTSNENKAKKLDLFTKLVESGKTMEEMEKFLKFFD